MINNSTNINKTTTLKNPQHSFQFENPDPGLGKAQKCGIAKVFNIHSD
jgi:hypothetical protein